ncbi:MAG: NAD-dependent epimerase/dehydratase family protein [Ktedonobacterales bacterium]|nr:NAD-dependent epimerase/dehydratase family protein [Ktedonobacterales bacterium]
MRILVTGGAGFIGSTVVDAYLAAGHEVAVVDSLWHHGGGKGANVPSTVRHYELDITDPALAQVFAEVQPQVVSHHAAQHSVKLSTDDPALDARVNVLGLLNVLENSRRHAVRKVIYASSAAIYGAPATQPINEATPQQPTSPYGITKMVGEHYLRYYRAAFGLEYTALRYANVYGPRQNPGGEAGVIAIFIHNLLTGQPITIHGDGEQARDYIFVADVADANVRALTAGDGASFCLGTGTRTSVNELYALLRRITGRDGQVSHAPTRAGDVPLAYFDNRHAKEALAWAPTVTLEEGLRRTVAAQS